MAEWLRRAIRNRMGSARQGSNPCGVVLLFKIIGFCFLTKASWEDRTPDLLLTKQMLCH